MLEKEIGFSVAERSDPIRLTQAGVLLLDCAQQTVNTYQDGLLKCSKLLAEAPPVRLQWFDTHTFFSEFLLSIDDIPFVFVSATEGEGGSYFSNLDRNQVDVVSTIDITKIADLMERAAKKGITAARAGIDRAAIVVSKNNPLATRKVLHRVDLKNAEVLMPDGACFDEWKSGILSFLGNDLNLKFILKPTNNSMSNLRYADFGNMFWISSLFDVGELSRMRDDVVIFDEMDGKPILLPRGILYRTDNNNPNVSAFIDRLVEFFL